VDAQTLQMIISIVTGAFATFFAIMLWPRTRDLAWMLVIIGTVVHYGAIIFQALEVFGIARVMVSDEMSATLIRAALLNVPFLFYSLGFIIMIRRKSGL
jgi:hypothetical protein